MHIGFVAEIECFDACSNGWGQYFQESLWRLVTTVKGLPDKKERTQRIKVNCKENYSS